MALCVKCFVLCITNAAELLVWLRQVDAIALSHQLNHASAAVDAAAEHAAQVAFFSSKDVLPLRLVAEKCQGVRDELPRGFQLFRNGRDKDDRAEAHTSFCRVRFVRK